LAQDGRRGDRVAGKIKINVSCVLGNPDVDAALRSVKCAPGRK
jgi:hypothetical protein